MDTWKVKSGQSKSQEIIWRQREYFLLRNDGQEAVNRHVPFVEDALKKVEWIQEVLINYFITNTVLDNFVYLHFALHRFVFVFVFLYFNLTV